jgi:Zn-dependent protease with chaperone function
MDYGIIRLELEKALSKELYALFQGDVIRRVLKESRVEEHEDYMRPVLEVHSFKITRRMAPRLNALCEDVRQALEFEEPVEFFVRSDAGINCAAYPRLTEEGCHLVMINSGVIERFDDDELRFVLGHELGHLISRNAELHRIMSFVFPPGSNVPLIFHNKVEMWNKIAELSADRSGFIASPRLDKCVCAFFKMASGLDTKRIDFDPHAYLEEMDKVLEYFRTTPAAVRGTHPINPIRIKALQYFAESSLYKAIAEGRELEPDAELDARLTPLLEELLRLSRSPLGEHRKTFLAAGGLLMAGIDGRVSDEEMERMVAPLAVVTSFPLAFLLDVGRSGKIPKLFQEAVEGILSVNPGERHAMLIYLIEVALADRRIQDRELAMLFDIGMGLLRFTRKEIAQQVGAAIQRGFVPRLTQLPRRSRENLDAHYTSA